MRRVVTVVCALFSAACAGHLAPNYSATLTAERSAPGAGKASTFAIAATDSVSSETVDIVRSGLEARGMKSASADRADVIVSVDLSMGAPVTVGELASVPLYRTQTSPGYATQRAIGTDRNGRTIYTPVTVAGTTTEYYVGEYYYCAATTVYDKGLRLSARPTAQASGVPAWDVSVAVRDNVKDPSTYAPVLARAAVSQADAAPQVGTPITLADGGRKVKARKASHAGQPALAPGVVRQRPGPGMLCGNDSATWNPAVAIRNAACMTLPVSLAYPVTTTTTPPIAPQNSECLRGLVGRPGDSRWR